MRAVFLKIYLIATPLLAIDHILYWSNKISLAGNTDQAFFWGWFILTVALVVINIRKKEVWIPLIIFGIIFVVTFIPMIFYIGVALPFAFKENLCQFKINETYPLQTEKQLALAIPKDHLIKRFGFLEKDIGTSVEFERRGARFDKDTTIVADTIDLYLSRDDYIKELCSVKSGRVLPDSINSKIRIELRFENWSEVLTFEK